MSDVSEDLATLFQGSGAIFLGTVIGKVLALIGIVLIVRTLTPETFGEVAFGYTIVSTLSGILVLGAPKGVARLVASTDSQDDKEEILKVGLTIALLGGVLGSIIIYFTRGAIEQWVNVNNTSYVVLLFIPYLLFQPIAKTIVGSLRAFQLSTKTVLSRDILPQLAAIGTFLTLSSLSASYLGAVVYWTIVPATIIFVGAYYVNQSANITSLAATSLTYETYRKFMGFAFPLAISASLMHFMYNLDVIILGFFLDERGVGLYRSIQPLKNIPLFFLTSISFLYLPIITKFFTKDELEPVRIIYRSATKWIVNATYPLVVFIVLFSPMIVTHTLGDNYRPAHVALVILTIGTFVRVIVGPNGATIQAINRTKIEMYSAICGVLINIVLNILLIPRIGIEGAAIATAISYSIYNFVEASVVFNELDIHPFSKNTIIPLVPTAIVGLVLIEPVVTYFESVFALIAGIIMIYLVHAISMIFTNSFDSNDIFVIENIEEESGISLKWLRTLIE